MASHTKILGWIYALLCGGSLLAGATLCILFWPAPNAPGQRAAAILGPVLLLAAYTVPGLAGGIGLLRGQAWARPVAILMSLLLLPMVPVGTAFGAYALWVLLGDRTQRSETWRLLVGKSGLLLLMLGVAAGFAVLLQIGFLVHDHAPPRAISQIFPAALLLLAAFSVLVCSGGWSRLARFSTGTPWRQGRIFRAWKPGRPLRDFDAEERQRLSELASDMARNKYVDLIRKGELWSNAQIAYAEQIDATATCGHLQSIERAMRKAGIFVKLVNGPVVKADCRIHLGQLTREYGEAVTALYEERHDIDRSYHDPKSAMFWCSACHSNLIVLHPEEARPDTRWFPPLGAELAER